MNTSDATSAADNLSGIGIDLCSRSRDTRGVGNREQPQPSDQHQFGRLRVLLAEGFHRLSENLNNIPGLARVTKLDPYRVRLAIDNLVRRQGAGFKHLRPVGSAGKFHHTWRIIESDDLERVTIGKKRPQRRCNHAYHIRRVLKHRPIGGHNFRRINQLAYGINHRLGVFDNLPTRVAADNQSVILHKYSPRIRPLTTLGEFMKRVPQRMGQGNARISAAKPHHVTGKHALEQFMSTIAAGKHVHKRRMGVHYEFGTKQPMQNCLHRRPEFTGRVDLRSQYRLLEFLLAFLNVGVDADVQRRKQRGTMQLDKTALVSLGKRAARRLDKKPFARLHRCIPTTRKHVTLVGTVMARQPDEHINGGEVFVERFSFKLSHRTSSFDNPQSPQPQVPQTSKSFLHHR